MPWQNQGGNGWSGGKNRGPWGQGPGGRGGGTPPDLEDILRRGQERLKDILPGGGGRTTWLLPVLALLALWLYNSIYVVSPEQRGVVLSFGEYSRTTGPGLHFLMWPIETVERPRVETENLLKFGENSTESLMLSGDQNIVDIKFTVLWRIKDAEQFLFNVAAQEQLVRVVAESSMREIVGRTSAEEIRTSGRQVAGAQVQQLIQSTLDSYDSGIQVTGVQLEKADPPPQVVDAFEEVQRAEQNQNRLIREAEQYRNQRLGAARGEAAKIVEDAKGYKARVVNEAQGEAQRFLSVYEQYAKAKDVTRERIFLETLETVLSQSNKVILGGDQGVVPYLPLPEIQKRQEPAAGQASPGASGQ
ncbi:MAG: FtsH protease activity modulator HflK [Pseudomonadota bacterium]|nr:FtsH protease activity modulator HflK [Pseudomonadota bacterium]